MSNVTTPSAQVVPLRRSSSTSISRPLLAQDAPASSYAIRFAPIAPPFPDDAETVTLKVSGPILRTPDEDEHALIANAESALNAVTPTHRLSRFTYGFRVWTVNRIRILLFGRALFGCL